MGKYYHYYHCSSSCGVRFNADKVNSDIVGEIRKHVRPLPKLQLYKEVILTVYDAKTRLHWNDMKQLRIQLDETNKKLSKARELLLTGDLDADDYRIIKSESEKTIN